MSTVVKHKLDYFSMNILKFLNDCFSCCSKYSFHSNAAILRRPKNGEQQPWVAAFSFWVRIVPRSLTTVTTERRTQSLIQRGAVNSSVFRRTVVNRIGVVRARTPTDVAECRVCDGQMWRNARTWKTVNNNEHKLLICDLISQLGSTRQSSHLR